MSLMDRVYKFDAWVVERLFGVSEKPSYIRDGTKPGTPSAKKRWDNDDAQIAVILFFFLSLAFIAFYIIVVGGMMDSVTTVHNDLTQSGKVPLSQDRQDAMAQIQGAFNSLPIIAFVLTIISALIVALATRYTVI